MEYVKDKKFNIVVDDEIASEIILPFSQLQEEQKKDFIDYYNLLKQNPKVVETTHLNYKPAKGSIFNGEEFIIPENLNIQHEPIEEGSPVSFTKRFAYLIDNVCKWTILFNEQGTILTFIYQSNPSFVEVIDTEEL